jgi:hypothetical protein
MFKSINEIKLALGNRLQRTLFLNPLNLFPPLMQEAKFNTHTKYVKYPFLF